MPRSKISKKSVILFLPNNMTILLFVIIDIKNKKYGNFVSISSLTGKCAAQKLKNFCGTSLWTCLRHMVIIKSQNKITNFLMILNLASGHVPLTLWYDTVCCPPS